MAALGEYLNRRIRAEATCDVCKYFYTAPVILRCGSSYCRACVEDLSPAVCPDCDAEFDPDRLTANKTLAHLVEVAQGLLQEEERREAAARRAASGGQPGREKIFFCKQEKAFVCHDCHVPHQHRGHDVVLADVAAQEYKMDMRKYLLRLRTEENHFQLHETTLEVDSEYHMRQVAPMWEKTKTEFQLMEDFLERQKREQLAKVTAMYQEIKMDRNAQLSALAKKLSSLRNVISEMEQASKLPGCKLLENVEGILRKFEERETVQPRGSLSVDLQDKFSSLVDSSMLLQGSMTNFRDTVELRLNRHRNENPESKQK